MRSLLITLSVLWLTGCGPDETSRANPDWTSQSVFGHLAINARLEPRLALHDAGVATLRERRAGQWRDLPDPPCLDREVWCVNGLSRPPGDLHSAWFMDGALTLHRLHDGTWEEAGRLALDRELLVLSSVAVGSEVHVLTSDGLWHHGAQGWRQTAEWSQEPWSERELFLASDGSLWRLDATNHGYSDASTLELFRWEGDAWAPYGPAHEQAGYTQWTEVLPQSDGTVEVGFLHSREGDTAGTGHSLRFLHCTETGCATAPSGGRVDLAERVINGLQSDGRGGAVLLLQSIEGGGLQLQHRSNREWTVIADHFAGDAWEGKLATTPEGCAVAWTEGSVRSEYAPWSVNRFDTYVRVHTWAPASP